MLVQRCALEHHRLIVPVSVTKPLYELGGFSGQFNQKNYRAIIDTGAQRTVLSQSVIAEQRLIRVGHMQFAGIHGPKTLSRYLARIALWAQRCDASSQPVDHRQSELTLFTLEEPFEIVDMDDNANFDLILGFDILKRFSFHYDATDHNFEIIISK